MSGLKFQAYDAGLLNDFGGGNVGWWQDYIRSELGRAEDFYGEQHEGLLEIINNLLWFAAIQGLDLRDYAENTDRSVDTWRYLPKEIQDMSTQKPRN